MKKILFILLGLIFANFTSQALALLQTPKEEPLLQKETILEYQGENQVQYSDEILFKATLKEKETLNPLANKKISWKVDGKNLASSFTNSEGEALATTKITLSSGNYTLLSLFEGDQDYKGSSTSSLLKVNKEDLSIQYTGPISGVEDETITLSAKISEQDNSVGNLSQKKIVFELGPIKRANTTNSLGETSVSFNLDLSPGTYALKVYFAGDAFYKPAQTQTSFEVKSKRINRGGGGGGGCFAERILKDTKLAWTLDLLRTIRDEFLLKFKLGREFTSFYYLKLSPTLIELFNLK